MKLSLKYGILRIDYKTEVNTEIWDERFDTPNDAVEYMKDYFGQDCREFVVLPIYEIGQENKGYDY